MRFSPLGFPLAAVVALVAATNNNRGQDYYLFTSFRDNGQDGLHLALSTNGY